MLRRCIDACITSWSLDSDYSPVFLKLQVMRHLNRQIKPHQHILNVDHQKLSNPDFRKNLCEEVMRNINGNLDFSYSDVSSAVVKSTSNVLSKTDKAQPGWFRAEESHVLPLVEARNDTIIFFNRRTRQSTARLTQASKNYKSAIHETKNKLIK